MATGPWVTELPTNLASESMKVANNYALRVSAETLNAISLQRT